MSSPASTFKAFGAGAGGVERRDVRFFAQFKVRDGKGRLHLRSRRSSGSPSKPPGCGSRVMSQEKVKLTLCSRWILSSSSRVETSAPWRTCRMSLSWSSRLRPPNAGTESGVKAARQWLKAWVDSFDSLTLALAEIRDDGFHGALVEYVQRGTPRAGTRRWSFERGGNDAPRGHLHAVGAFPTSQGSPRSRRAVGVGDVGGDRGDRAAP